MIIYDVNDDDICDYEKNSFINSLFVTGEE